MKDRFKRERRMRGLRGVGKFLSDERGLISVMAAFSLVLVLGIAAVVVDAGALMLTRRTLQSTTDAAALSAAQHLDNPTDAVMDVLRVNGYSEENIEESPELGVYTTEDRFHPPQAGETINAVRIRLKTDAATYFARALGLGNFNTVHTKAAAAIVPTVTFGAGTQLADIDTSTINTVLSGLLGANVQIADYSALANARIDALSLFETLATSVGLTVGSATYDQLLQAQVSIPQVLDAAASELLKEDNSSAAASLLQLLAGRASSGRTFSLGSILDASYLTGKVIGQGRKGAQIGALDLVQAAIGSANTGESIDVGLNIPNLTQAKLAIGAPMKFAVGPEGTEVHTAQIRLKVEAGVTILETGVSVPIYIEAAQGTARVERINCQPTNLATLAGTSGLVTASFARISNSALVDFSAAAAPAPATISILGYPAISLSGTVTAFGIGPVEKTFGHLGQTERISATDPGASLLSDLSNNITVSPNLPIVTSTIRTLVQTLSVATMPVLQALGVHLGNLDMTLSGAKCTPVLVE